MAQRPLHLYVYRKLQKAVRIFDADPARRALLVARPRQRYALKEQRWEGMPVPDEFAAGRAAVDAALLELNGGGCWYIPGVPAGTGSIRHYIAECFRRSRIPGVEGDGQPPSKCVAAALAALRLLSLAKSADDVLEQLPEPVGQDVVGDLLLTQLPQGIDCFWGEHGVRVVDPDPDPDPEEAEAEEEEEQEQVEIVSPGEVAQIEGPPDGARILVAHPLMDGFFKRAVMVVSHHRDGEAIAFIINRPLIARVAESSKKQGAKQLRPLRLSDMVPGRARASTLPGLTSLVDLLRDNPIFCGGPVGMGDGSGPVTLRFLHRCQGIPGAQSCGGGLFVDGEAEALRRQLEDGTASASDFLVLLGYSGWGDSQLAGEISQGTWVVCQARNAVPVAFFSQDSVRTRMATEQADDADREAHLLEVAKAEPEAVWRLCLLRTEDAGGSGTRSIAQLTRLQRVDTSSLLRH
eukprot:TRINITY_DN10529_c3_g1_i1.p2 TRINITY_DN10529_c3_g1~~TRINITY_DN10529_c3_g1_i1.p2  ORF type:complete len:491 (+),score=206.14 TRINITY_DN10529_c3_g1_i1:87-1475(+)